MGIKAHVKKSAFDVSYQLETTLTPGVVIPINYHRFWPGELMVEQIFGSFMIQTLSVDVMDEMEGWCITAVASDYDLYDDAYKVLGDRKSLEDNNTYRLPYILNQVAPLYIKGTNADTKTLNSYFSGTEITNFDANSTYMSDDTLGDNAYNGVATTFTYNNRTYNVPYSLNWWFCIPPSILAPTTLLNIDQLLAESRFLKSMMPTQKGLGIVHYLSGVVGDTLKPLNALPYIFYYLYCDTFHRHTKFQSCFVSEDPRVDHDYKASRTGKLNFIDYETTFDGTGTLGTALYVSRKGYQFYPCGFVCNKYDEEQRDLTRFLNACCVNNSEVTDHESYIFSTLLYDSIFKETGKSVMESKYYAQFFAFTHGGLYPLMGRPDYINMLFDTPQQGDPVKLFNAETAQPMITIPGQDINIEANDRFKLKNMSGSMVNAGTIKSNNDGALYQDGVQGTLAYNSGLKGSFEDQDVSFSLPDAYNLTIDELRMKFQLNKYLVRANIAGNFIGDIYNAMYGTTISDSALRLPRIVQASKIKFSNIPVVQTGASESQQALQGNLTANSIASLKTQKTKIYSSQFGYSMTFIFFGSKQIRHSFYEADTFEFSHFDLWNPLFNFLSFEDVKQRQVFNKLEDTRISHTYGDHTSRLGFNRDTVPSRLFELGYRFAKSDFIMYRLMSNSTVRAGAMKEINESVRVRGYSERYGFKRYAMNKVSGYFDPRLRSVSSLDPRMKKTFTSYNNANNPSLGSLSLSELYNDNGTFHDLVPAADIVEWTLARDYDNELPGLMEQLNVPSLLDSTPWERAFQLSNTQPIYAKFYFARKIVVGLPVFAIPGYADHF